MANATLAVDFFFALSGFVISYAYDRRFAAGLSPTRFLWLRFGRLYPLYIFGTALGIGVLAKFAAGGRDGWDWQAVAIASLPALLLLPTLHQNPADELYPANGPAWSLFDELLVNAVYALSWRWLTVRCLLVVVGVSAVALIVAGVHFGTLNIGYSISTVVGGFARVAFSFTAGVLIHRISGERSARIPAIVLAAVLPTVFAFRGGVVYQLSCTLFVLPAIVWAGAHNQPKFGRAVWDYLGRLSYPIYVIHMPLYYVAISVFPKIGVSLGPLPGVLYVAGLAVIAAALDRYFDPVIRRLLSQGLASTQQRMAAARD